VPQSRRKGKRGEYLVRNMFIHFGFLCRRGIQSAGEADIVHDLPGNVHVEIKNDERLSIWAMIAQCERDALAREALESVVFFKRNGTPIYAAHRAEEYLRAKRLQSIVAEFIEVLEAFKAQGGTLWTYTIHDEYGTPQEVLDEFIDLARGATL